MLSLARRHKLMSVNASFQRSCVCFRSLPAVLRLRFFLSTSGLNHDCVMSAAKCKPLSRHCNRDKKLVKKPTICAFPRHEQSHEYFVRMVNVDIWTYLLATDDGIYPQMHARRQEPANKAKISPVVSGLSFITMRPRRKSHHIQSK
jgi:hypothetical protein